MDDPYSFDEDKVKDEGSFQVSISTLLFINQSYVNNLTRLCQ